MTTGYHIGVHMFVKITGLFCGKMIEATGSPGLMVHNESMNYFLEGNLFISSL